MQSANLSGPFRGCLYYALLGLPQATGLAGGYDCAYLYRFGMFPTQQLYKLRDNADFFLC